MPFLHCISPRHRVSNSERLLRYKKSFRAKSFLKRSLPALKCQDFILRYLGSRTRLRTQGSKLVWLGFLDRLRLVRERELRSREEILKYSREDKDSKNQQKLHFEKKIGFSISLMLLQTYKLKAFT